MPGAQSWDSLARWGWEDPGVVSEPRGWGEWQERWLGRGAGISKALNQARAAQAALHSPGGWWGRRGWAGGTALGGR